MLVYSNDQIKKADAFTIANEPIASIDLMERASRKCVEFILSHFSNQKNFVVCAGPGNNGGDGLAIARMLLNEKLEVKIILLGEKFSADNKINQGRLHDFKSKFILPDEINFENKPIIIDALFGTGINNELGEPYRTLINSINNSDVGVISIDLPSGLIENGFEERFTAIKADITLTFQYPKINFFLPETGNYIGEFVVLDIGLHPDSLLDEKPFAYFLLEEMVAPMLKIRSKFAHKGSFGHACLIGGSYGKMGAVELSTLACMRSGAGLTTAIVPKCGYEIMQVVTPEAMVITSNGEQFHWDLKTDLSKFTAIGIGPGMGTEKETANVLKYIIQNANCSLVIDADGLNILSENKTWLAFLPEESILTPHPGEFKRLVGEWKDGMEMIQLQKDFSFKNNCYVVLKGAHTSISTPGGNIYFNSTGNNGLAKGGSGDTLTGIITALLAQGYSSMEASLIGVFIHGKSADMAIEHIAPESLLATDVIQHLSEAFSSLRN